MSTATYTRPNYTTDQAATYKARIDAAAKVFERLLTAFAPHQQDVGSPAPELSIRVDAGFICNPATPSITEVAAQTVGGFTTPNAGQHRVDRVVIDALTGEATRVAGTPATGSPSATPPAIPSGKLPCCRILITDSDTAITDDMITDERTFPL